MDDDDLGLGGLGPLVPVAVTPPASKEATATATEAASAVHLDGSSPVKAEVVAPSASDATTAAIADGVDKVKTIGDAYIVCAGALSDIRPDDAERVVRMGLEMQKVVARIARKEGVDVAVRIGVHTGRCTGGIMSRWNWKSSSSLLVATAARSAGPGRASREHRNPLVCARSSTTLAVDIIVIASVAALVPKAEIEGEMGTPQIGP